MKVLFIGVFNETSTNNSQARGFENAGWEVNNFNYREVANLTSNKDRDRFIVDTCRNEKFDLVLFSKCDEIDASVVVECGKITKTALWYMDPMENFSMALQLKAGLCDLVFCALESPYRVLKKFNENCYLIPEGFDNTIDFPQKEEFIYDVSFIGSVKWDRAEYNKISPFAQIEDAYGVEHAKTVAKSKINLNFVVNNEGVSDRVYKILAAKGFLLTQPWPGMEKQFTPNQDFIVFNGFDEYKKHIKYFLKHNNKRLKIAEQGYKSVQKYTRDNWAKEITEYYEKN